MYITKEELQEFWRLYGKQIVFYAIIFGILIGTNEYWWGIKIVGNITFGFIFILLLANVLIWIYFIMFKGQLLKLQFFALNQFVRLSECMKRKKK